MRAVLSGLGVLRRPAPAVGVSHGRVARPIHAEKELSSLATSPTVYGATTWRAFSLARYPLEVCRGHGKDAEVLDPERVPWVGALLRLLKRPDPADWHPEALFPAHPGEGVLAQLLGDLNSGNAYVAPTVTGNTITGLQRLHPQWMTLIRRGDEEWWCYKPTGAAATYYPRRTIAHLRLLSWQSSGASEIGTGPGAPLANLVAAESEALRQTADTTRQGGVDVIVTGKSEAATAYLQDPKRRKEVAQQVTQALAGGADGSRRAMVVSGDLEIKDAGLTPADLRAPEVLEAARAAELVALGVTPISVGSESGTYATAVQQHRVQYNNDLALVGIVEAYLLRPLAQHFASQAGGRWAARADAVTCRLSLDTHPGAAYLRDQALTYAQGLHGLGWSPEQAVAAAGLDLPAPDGEATTAPVSTPGANAPRNPLGDTESGAGEPATPAEEPRTVLSLLQGGRAFVTSTDPDGSRRSES